MALLARREHGRTELRTKLLQKGHGLDEIEAVLDRLEENGLLDDRRAAEGLARHYANGRGHGPRRVRSELARKQLPSELIDAGVEALERDWREVCRELAARRKVVPGDRRSFEKLVRFLVGRGYPPDMAREIANERHRPVE